MKYTKNKDGYVRFGDVSRNELNKQCQYGSLYINGFEGYPNLGEGLRFRNLDEGNYHAIEIHVDDITEFVRRYKTYLAYKA